MAKKFEGLSERNSNLKSGKSLLFQKSTSNEENTLSTQIKEEVKEAKPKFFNLPLPQSWHEQLKYEIAKDTGKSVKDLILDALEKTYKFK